jgi:hypothetical protein
MLATRELPPAKIVFAKARSKIFYSFVYRKNSSSTSNSLYIYFATYISNYLFIFCASATFIPQMAIDHGLIENQNLVVVDAPGQQAHRHIGLVWRPSSSRVSTFNQLAEVVSELL